MKSLASIVALAVFCSAAAAAPVFYPDKPSWLTATRADLNTNYPLATPGLVFHPDVNHAGPTRAVTFTSSNPSAPNRLASWGTGLGAPDPVWVTTIATEHTATSAGFFLRVANAANQSVGGPVLVTTATFQFTVNVPAAGQWVSFTAPEGFTTINLQANNGVGVVEMLEDVNIGEMVGAPFADQASDAPVLTLGAGTSVSRSVTNSWATADPFAFIDQNGSNYPASNDVWVRVISPSDGSMSFTTQAYTFDTVLAVYDVSSSNPSAGVRPLGMDDDTNGGLASRVVIDVQQGHVYAVRIGGYSGTRGTTTFTATLTGQCDADFNHDGFIDFFDYLDFVDSFARGC